MEESLFKDHVENFMIKTALVVVALPFIALGVVWLPVIGFLIAFGVLALILFPFGTRREVNIVVGVQPRSRVQLPEAESADTMPVVILSRSAAGEDERPFDATHIRTDSVRFGPGEAKPIGNPQDPLEAAALRQDMNGDGIVDLVLYFSKDETGISDETDTVCVTGETLEGEYFRGCGHLHHAV
jgi:hypothetical protein